MMTIRTPPLRAILEAALPPMLFDKAVETLADPDLPRKDILDPFRRIVASFPGGPVVERAREIVEILEEMLVEDEAHERATPKPLEEMTLPERIEELIFLLRNERRPVGQSMDAAEAGPVRQLVALGPEAAPRLIEALPDDALTRCVEYGDPQTVGDFAWKILQETAGLDFNHYYRISDILNRGDILRCRRALARAWYGEVRSFGERVVLAERAKRAEWNSRGTARRLAERYPAEALGPILEGIRRLEGRWVGDEIRIEYIEAAAKIPGDSPVPFLQEQVEKGPFIGGRLAAARALWERGRPEGLAAIERGWAGQAEEIEFILESWQGGDALAVLNAGWGRRPVEERIAMLRIAASLADQRSKGGEQQGAGGRDTDRRVLLNLEAFLLGLLGDLTPCRIPRAIAGDEWRAGRMGRICDLAAHILTTKWPGKYRFLIGATVEERDRAIVAMGEAPR
jgi:hypothetical protein